MRLHAYILLLIAFALSNGLLSAFDLYKHVFLGVDWMCVAVRQDEKDYLGFLLLGELTLLEAKKVQLNYKNDSPSPLIDRKVKFLDVLFNKPVVIFEDEPSTIYCVLTLATDDAQMQIISSDPLTVTQGDKQVPAEIVHWTRNIFFKSKDEKEYWYYVALKPRGGNWGDEGSSIVALNLTYELIDDESEDTEASLKEEEADEKKKIRRLYFKEMDRIECRQLCKLSPDSSIPTLEVLYWDDVFERIYLGFSFSDSGTIKDDSPIILIARVADEKLVIDSLLKASDCKYFAQQSMKHPADNGELSVTKIQTLHGSTGLPFLIISGTYGTKPYTLSLPLVNSSYIAYEGLKKNTSHGKIASIKQKPIDHYYPNGRRFKGKTVHEEAEDLQQFSSTSVCITMSPIDSLVDIWAVQDTLYALHGTKEHPLGVLYCHAIFDSDGYIAGWTKFKPVPGSASGIIDFLVFPSDMHYAFFQKDKNNVVQMRKTAWKFYGRGHSEQQDCYDALQKEFSREQGGIQGLWFFELFQGDNNPHPLLVAGGREKLAMTLLDTHTNDQIITYSSDIADLSIVTAACLISNETTSKIIIGGVNGISQLHDQTGNGWKHSDENFLEAAKNYRCTKIGNQRFVKKLLTNGSHLYVLTRNKIEYCDVASLLTNTEQDIQFKELAHSDAFDGVFTDIEVLGNLFLLGTTQGLFYMNIHEGIWHKLNPMPDMQRVQSLCLRPSYDATQAQLFVMTVQNDRSAHLLRFHVDVQTSQITQLVDYGFKNQAMAYASFGGYRTRFVTDGAMLITSRGGRVPLIHVMPVFISGKQLPSSKGYLSEIPWTGDNTVTGIVQNTISGSWIAGGDFGIAVFE